MKENHLRQLEKTNIVVQVKKVYYIKQFDIVLKGVEKDK